MGIGGWGNWMTCGAWPRQTLSPTRDVVKKTGRPTNPETNLQSPTSDLQPPLRYDGCHNPSSRDVIREGDERVAPLSSAWLLAALIAAGPQIRTVDGAVLRPLAPSGAANVLFFVATDCPISNGYAPEIQRICRAYAPKGVSCALIYEDVGVTTDAVRKHLADYRYEGMAAAIDKDGTIAQKLGTTVTPEAAVVDHAGAVRYRGRLDNLYAALGKPRRVVTVHDLQDALESVLSGKPVAAPETTPIGCFIVPPDMRR